MSKKCIVCGVDRSAHSSDGMKICLSNLMKSHEANLIMVQEEKRKVVQVAANGTWIPLALCNDGSIWGFDGVAGTKMSVEAGFWKRLPDIPQDEVKDETD